jgi:hypothetical protein
LPFRQTDTTFFFEEHSGAMRLEEKAEDAAGRHKALTALIVAV